MHRLVPSALLAVACVLACAGGDWAAIRSQDSPAAYRRFLRQHPESRHAPAALERLAYLQFESRPTVEGFERFRVDFPQSPLLPELSRLLENAEFERARRQGTASAYAAFLGRFPSGEHAARAHGNAEYLRAGAFAARPGALAEFIAHFPQSDYSEGARRSLALGSVRQQTRLRRVGLRIHVDPPLPGAERLIAVFADRAQRSYAAAGVQLVRADGATEAAGTAFDGWLTIQHTEAAVSSEFRAGLVVPAGVRATTRLTLERAGDAEAIWSETFTFQASELERRPGASILFSARAPAFWRRFFVPVAGWRTDLVRHPTTALPSGAVAIDVREQRAVTLFSDGSFLVLDLADPARPQRVAEYRRPRDLTRFDGVRCIGESVAVFGEGGLELVALDATGAHPARVLPRHRVGTLRAAEQLGADLVVAGNQGLLRVPRSAPEEVESLLAGPVRDLAAARELLFFIDDRALYVAGLEDLRAGRVRARVRLGRGFAPARVRAGGGVALVVGRLGTIAIDVSQPDVPRQLGRVGRNETGRVEDALLFGGKAFLLGERGLLVFDPASGRIAESVDVEPRLRLAAWGRHLVILGPAALQVVDGTPWSALAAAAAPAR